MGGRNLSNCQTTLSVQACNVLIDMAMLPMCIQMPLNLRKFLGLYTNIKWNVHILLTTMHTLHPLKLAPKAL